MLKIEGSVSGSISQRHGSADPDPHQNVMDPQHWLLHLPGPPGVRHGRQVGRIAVRPGLLVVSAATAFQAFQPLLTHHSPGQPEMEITKNKIHRLDCRFSPDFLIHILAYGFFFIRNLKDFAKILRFLVRGFSS
jgi:hypothetical protein